MSQKIVKRVEREAERLKREEQRFENASPSSGRSDRLPREEIHDRDAPRQLIRRLDHG